MKVSVVIPVFNVQKYLEACLDSVLSQELDDFEVICVNDGSTDDSKSILERYAQRDSRIRIMYHGMNRGLSEARNTGIQQASGEYLYFLDSDDMLAQGALKEMYEYAKRENLDVLYFDATALFESSELEAEYRRYKNTYHREISYGIFEHGWELFAGFVDGDDYCVQSSLQFLRRDYVEHAGLRYYPGLLFEDNLFNLQCMMWAGRVAHINQSFFCRRIREGSIITGKKDIKSLMSAYISYKEMCRCIETLDADVERKISNELSKVLDMMLETVCTIYFYHIDWSRSENQEGLEGIAKYEIPRLVNRKDEMEYPFPYHLLSEGSRVVVYGAGKIGKSYYKQLNWSSYVKLVGWVDRNDRELSAQGYPVEAVSSLRDKEFDNLFIAIADKHMATEVMRELTDMGVDEECMVWKGAEYVRYMKRQRPLLSAEYRIYKQAWESGRPKCWLFMTPEHGNMGDYALAFAQKKYLYEFFSEYTYVDVATEDWKKYRQIYMEAVGKEDILFLSGGGFIGDMWPSGKTLKSIIEAFPDNQKIILPNTLTFVKNNRNAMKEEAHFYRKQDNLLMFARDRNSYEIMHSEGYRKEDELGCYPDMALLLNFCKEKTRREDVLICLRDDCEKRISEEAGGYLLSLLQQTNLTCLRLEMHLHRQIKKDNAEQVFMKKIREFYSAGLVITDRLHAMIFAAITGTPCIAVDNSTGKVSGLYEWIKHLPYICCVDERVIDKALIQKMVAYGTGIYDNSEIVGQISRMTKQIKSNGRNSYENRSVDTF